MLRLNVLARRSAVLGLAVSLAGCSADFVRFDSPAFSLNGDTASTSAPDDVSPAYAPTGETLSRRRTADATDDAGVTRRMATYSGSDEPPSVANVTRSAARADDRRANQAPRRVASSAPLAGTRASAPQRRNSAPVTTGALRSQRSITVEPGDTLYQLSRRHGVTVAALRSANGLTGNVIQPGQTLVLPGDGAGSARVASVPSAATTRTRAPHSNSPRFQRPAANRTPANTTSANTNAGRHVGGSYTVRPGDSLYRISRRTGISVAELKRTNGITNVRQLRPGMRLALGGGAAPQQPVAQRPESRSATRPATRVAARTETGRQQPVRSEIRTDVPSGMRSETIKAKPIRTVPITRSNDSTPTSTTQPRILNKRPATPIATKPPQKTAMVAPAASAEQSFRWPARGRVIASFNRSPKGVRNDGINIALPLGTDIAATKDGVVAYAGSELKGYGNLVLLRHDNGWVSAYAHASEILVKRGDRVTRGQTIAKVGRSGDVSQPQLHFELRKGAKPVDPLPHLGQL